MKVFTKCFFHSALLMPGNGLTIEVVVGTTTTSTTTRQLMQPTEMESPESGKPFYCVNKALSVAAVRPLSFEH